MIMIRGKNVVSASSNSEHYRHTEPADRRVFFGHPPDELEQVQENAEVEMLRAQIRVAGWISIDTSHD
jgi:hypothetical protein